MENLKTSNFESALLMSRNKLLTENIFFNYTYNMCKDDFTTISVVMFFRKDFFLVPAINDVISDLESGGLIDYWHMNSIYKLQRYGKVQSSQAKKITLDHLDGCFKIWICGNLISFACFIVEFVVKKSFKKLYEKCITCRKDELT